MREEKPVIVFILGPTGAGKSDFAVRLAKKIGGEIISCDSMQVYKGMPIMSQQPPAESRKAVPHHLVGVLSPSQEWSAADFAEMTKKIAEDIVRRGKVPIIAGGTGLYARAFAKGLFISPPKDEELRRVLYEKAKSEEKESLYRQLLKIDPVSASKIHPNDLRRIVRALEVYELTGRPISEKHRETRGIEGDYEILIYILNRDRKDLYKRIDERLEEMFAGGIVKEVKKLKKRKVSKTAKAVLGYKEISDYLEGKYSMEEAKELLKRNSRHYAKRQLTWFRKEQVARWLELGTIKQNTVLVNRIVRKVKR